MSLVESFNGVLAVHGSTAIYHRDQSLVPCPCLTPEGFRDPEWHEAHPTAPVCNERGYLPAPGSTVDISVKAFVQPSQATRGTRITVDYLTQMFGEVEIDDHIGIFPESWNGTILDFYDWSQSGEDYILYNGRKYMVVGAHLIPDPSDGNPRHHWEVGLRLMTSDVIID